MYHVVFQDTLFTHHWDPSRLLHVSLVYIPCINNIFLLITADCPQLMMDQLRTFDFMVTRKVYIHSLETILCIFNFYLSPCWSHAAWRSLKMLNSNSKLSSPSALGSWGWTTDTPTTILHSYKHSVFHFQNNTLRLG